MKKINEQEIEVEDVIYIKAKGDTCYGCAFYDEHESGCISESDLGCTDFIWNIKPATFEDLINRNYETVKRRGQLSDYHFEHIEKIKEEVKELVESYHKDSEAEMHTELADVILVCFTMAKHFDIDILNVIKQKVEYNEKRVD